MTPFKDLLGDPMSFRQWLAWKLVQLAARIHDAEHEESITFKDPDGKIALQWFIVGDDYGAGISSQSGGILPEGWSLTVTPWDDFHENSVDITDRFN